MRPYLRRDARGPQGSPRLVCFPASGGLGANYLSWSDRLNSVSQIVGVDLPGRGAHHRFPPAVDMAQLVGLLADNLADVADGAVFYGHSFGAICAFETARFLEVNLGCGPLRIIVGAAAAPSMARVPRAVQEQDLLTFVASLGGTSEGILTSPDIQELFLPGVRRDLDLFDSYRPFGRLSVAAPVLALAGAHDPVVAPDEVRRWREVTTGEFRFETLDGGHFFYRDAPEAFFPLIDAVIGDGSDPLSA